MDISQKQLRAGTYRKKSGKTPGPKIMKTPQRKLCATLSSRNAHGYHTKPLLCENLQQKRRGPESVPWPNPSLNTYRKNSVDTLLGELDDGWPESVSRGASCPAVCIKTNICIRCIIGIQCIIGVKGTHWNRVLEIEWRRSYYTDARYYTQMQLQT